MAPSSETLEPDFGGPPEARDHARLLRASDDRRYLRLGLAAVATAVLPVSLAADGGLYLWQVLRTASAVDALRILAPPCFGLWLVALSFAPRVTRLAQSLLALAALALAVGLFSDARVAYREAFSGLLDFVGRNALPAVLGLGLIAAGSDLRVRGASLRHNEVLRRGARVMLWLGAALIVLVYVVPIRGTPHIVRVGESVVGALKSGQGRMLAGLVLFWVLGLWPLGCAVGALVAQRRSARPSLLLGFLARYGLSILAAALCLRLLFDLDGHRVLLQLRSALLFAVAIGTLATAVEAVARHLCDDPLPPLPPASTLARDVRLRTLLRAYLAGGAEGSVLDAPGVPPSHPLLRWLMRQRLAALATETEDEGAPANLGPLRPDAETARAWLASLEARGGTPQTSAAATPTAIPGAASRAALWLLTGKVRLWALATFGSALAAGLLAWRIHQPAPNLAWELGAASPHADELFSGLLPRYVVALSERNAALQSEQSGGEAAQIVRQLASEVLTTARDVDRELARRIERLLGDAEVVDESGQLWIDGIHGVNRRVRELGLPYYVDGNVLEIVSDKDGRRHVRRLFYLTTYRVERIERRSFDGRELAALHVRRLDHLNIRGTRLGMVRRDEPFALVVLDVVERASERLRDALAEGRCGFDDYAAQNLDRSCAATLRAVLAERGLDTERQPEEVRAALVAVQTAATERHELQHQLDGEDLPIPSALYELVPWAGDDTLEVSTKELSALVAELADGDDLGLTVSAVDVLGFALSPSHGRYHFAALAIFGELLGTPVAKPRGPVSVSGLELFWQDVDLHRGALRAWLVPKARAAHDALVGTELPPTAAP
ncbi:MAG: hypothetical protein IT373_13090 [Polyangiaceae bacterium]|nr:hypothetical protein [Polyangiaceae bacterium]